MRNRELDYIIHFLNEKDVEMGGVHSKEKSKLADKFKEVKDDISGKM